MVVYGVIDCHKFNVRHTTFKNCNGFTWISTDEEDGDDEEALHIARSRAARTPRSAASRTRLRTHV
jgi:hypothetical protein